MNTIRVLRSLVLCELGIIVVEVAGLAWQETTLPPLLKEYLASEGTSEFTVTRFLYLLGGVVPFIAFVIASIGLFRLWRPARELFLVSLIAFELLGLISRPRVFAPPVGLIDTLGSMVAGAILAIAYFTEVRERFGVSGAKVGAVTEEPPNQRLQPTGRKTAGG